MPDPDEVLQHLLKQESLTPEEAKQGLVSCFLVTNRRFVERRLGPRPPAEIDAATQKLIDSVLERHLSGKRVTLVDLKQVRQVLIEQCSFESEPDLLAMHVQMLDDLFARVKLGAD
ncbi:MAG: hypothetical protein AAB571_03125 [Chloroflexota bacterium]